MPHLRLGTVCFLVKDNQVMLGRIHYPNGDVYWNGIGGFVEDGESSEQAVIREYQEELRAELDIETLKFKKRIKISSDLELDVFVATNYQGDLSIVDSSISEIKWFAIDELPFDEMPPGNADWLPKVFK